MPRADHRVCALPLSSLLDSFEERCASVGVLSADSGVPDAG
jgi:hypothetical protein